MPYDVRSFTVPYKSDMGLNLFGDYDALVQRVYRDQKTKKLIAEWFLTGPRGAPPKELTTRDEINLALASFFFQSAEGKDEPVVTTPNRH
jgi:hypothetical protein